MRLFPRLPRLSAPRRLDALARVLVAGLVALASLGRVCAADVPLPPPGPDWVPPADAPAVPGDSLNLNFTGAAPAADAPVISEWTRVVKPGQSFSLSGIRFTRRAGADAGTDTVVWLWGHTPDGGSLRRCIVWHVEDSLLTASVPDDLPNGLFFVWVENQAGPSAPIGLNRPEAVWVGPAEQGNTVAPGAIKRVFGRNLSTAHGTTTTYVYTQSIADGDFALANLPADSAEANKVEPYAVKFTTPSDAGTYRVYVHNGHGGAYGWSEPLTFTVAAAWTRDDFSSSLAPSGGDDTSALQTALNSVGNRAKGGTVQLQAGTYTVTNGVNIPSNVRLRGAGRDQTTVRIDVRVRYHAGGDIAEESCFGLNSRSAIEDLTLTHVLIGYNARLIRQGDGSFHSRLANIRVNGTNGEGRPRLVNGNSNFRDSFPWPGRGAGVSSLSPSPGGDDTSAIQAALNARAAAADLSGAGTVRLAAGTFTLTSPLTIKPGVRLEGAVNSNGDPTTTLRVNFPANSTATHGIAFEELVNGGDRTEQRLRNLNLRVLSLPAGAPLFHRPDTVRHMRLEEVRIAGIDGSLDGTPQVLFQRGDIVDSEFWRFIYLAGADALWIRNSVFYGSLHNDAEAALFTIYPNTRMIVEDNRFETPDWPTGPNGSRNYLEFLGAEQIKRRNFCIRVYSGGGSRQYWSRNVAKDVAPGNNDQNKGEMILFHEGQTGVYAQVASVSGNTFTIRSDGTVNGKVTKVDNAAPRTTLPDWVAEVAIIAGTGRGQLRGIASKTATTVTVSRPWRVPPAADSVVVFFTSASDNIVYKNQLDAFPEGYVTNYSASGGVVFSGNNWFSIAEGNVSRRTYGGRLIGGYPTAPAYWNQMRDETAEGVRAVGFGIKYWGRWSNDTDYVGSAILGAAYQGGSVTFNTAAQTLSLNTQVGVNIESNSFVGGHIVENVTTNGSRIGVQSEANDQALVRRSSFTVAKPANETKARIGTNLVSPTRVWLSENTYAGQQTLHNGAGSARVLPLHRSTRFTLRDGFPLSQDLTIANVGGASGTWSVTSTGASWLSAETINTSLDRESPSGLLRLRVSPGAVPLGDTWVSVQLSRSVGATQTAASIGVKVGNDQPPFGQWRYNQFGTFVNAGSAADLADPDSDGMPNFLEYALGSAPQTPAASPLVRLDRGAAGELRLLSPRPRAELGYLVESSTDLVNWSPLPASWTALGEGLWSHALSSDAGDPRRFWRLRIFP